MVIAHNDVTVIAFLYNGIKLNSKNVKVVCIYIQFSNRFNGYYFQHFKCFKWTAVSCLSNFCSETSRQQNTSPVFLGYAIFRCLKTGSEIPHATDVTPFPSPLQVRAFLENKCCSSKCIVTVFR